MLLFPFSLTDFLVRYSAPYGSIQDQDFKLASYFAWGGIWEGHQTGTANRQCRFIILHFAGFGLLFFVCWYLSEVTSSELLDCSKIKLEFALYHFPVACMHSLKKLFQHFSVHTSFLFSISNKHQGNHRMLRPAWHVSGTGHFIYTLALV